jgi:hypothetical protein
MKPDPAGAACAGIVVPAAIGEPSSFAVVVRVQFVARSRTLTVTPETVPPLLSFCSAVDRAQRLLGAGDARCEGKQAQENLKAN